MAPTNFLVSAVTPEYVLMYEDLEPRVSDERIYAMLVFCYLNVLSHWDF